MERLNQTESPIFVISWFCVFFVSKGNLFWFLFNSFGAKFQTTFVVWFFFFFIKTNYRLEKSLYVNIIWLSNSVDPDETAHHEPSRLDLRCLQKPIAIAYGNERAKPVLAARNLTLKHFFSQHDSNIRTTWGNDRNGLFWTSSCISMND